MKNKPWENFTKHPSIKKAHLFNKNHLLETSFIQVIDEILNALFRAGNNFIPRGILSPFR